ncbi:MAG: porin family protein [Cytophagaceae bacterium]
MKKFLFVYFCCLLFAFEGFSQVRLGLRFSPGLAISRAIDREPTDDLTIKARGVGVRFFAGPEISYFFGDNYSLVTGIWYSSRRAGLRIDQSFGTFTQPLVEEVYNLQYLQIPVTMRLFTNEIATNTKLYFQLGGTLDIKLAEKAVVLQSNYIDRFRRFDSSVIFGSGIQIQLGSNTALLLGASYMRGLLNSISRTDVLVNPQQQMVEPNYRLNNDLLSIDVGIRF